MEFSFGPLVLGGQVTAWIYFMFRRRKRLGGGQSSRSAVIGERLIGRRPQIIFPRSTKSGFWACMFLNPHRQNKWHEIFSPRYLKFASFIYSPFSA
jgi:hypothetical protein